MTITMTRKEAKQLMSDFLNAHKGQTVFFKALREPEKTAYVLCDQFNYFRFLRPTERLERAIKNTESHAESNYELYDTLFNKMIIANE